MAIPAGTTSAGPSSTQGAGGGAQGGAPGDGGSGGFMLGTGGNVGGNSGSGGNCDGQLNATIRDFAVTPPFAHPDFETFGGTTAFVGIVEGTLGGDNKPVYAHAGATQQTTGPGEFAQWVQRHADDQPGVQCGAAAHRNGTW